MEGCITIKKFLKICFYSFILSFVVLFATDKTYASENVPESKAKITITNDQTGETKVLSPKETKNALKVNSIKKFSALAADSENEGLEVGYDVFVPVNIPTSSGSGMTTADTDGSSKTAGGVTAKLYVNYDVSTNNEKVRLNKVYGSWTPSSSMYSLSNRYVEAHSGTIYGKTIVKKPTSNSFSYPTGWGYNYRALGQASPRAWSSAKISISGMTSTYTIKVEFTYS